MAMSFMEGNEAIARGAYEAGVTVATGYPGTPSTEILENAVRYKDAVYCEWSPNEKVAFEVAAGASLAGARAICTPGWKRICTFTWSWAPAPVRAYTSRTCATCSTCST